MPPISRAALMLALALLLSACGGGAQPEPTVAPMERPTSTPRPTVTPKPDPTAAPEPTDAPEPTAAPEPTPKTIGGNTTNTGGDGGNTGDSGELAPVEVDALETYTHPGGLFSIDVPSNWTSEDSSNDTIVAVTWSDPSNNALTVVFVTEEQSQLSTEDLTARLQDFVNTSQDEPDFSADPPSELESGGVQIIWGYTAEADGGIKARLLVNSFIYQNEDKISILMFGVPNDQFDRLKDSLDSMLGSYQVDPSVALGAAAIDDGMPDAERYDFSDEKGAWVEQDTDAVAAERAGGIFTMQIKIPNQFYVSNPDMEIGTDQAIAATVEPSGDARAGVFVRLTEANGDRDYYACWIDAVGTYGCFVSIRDSWTDLQGPTATDTLIPGAPNRIKLTAEGETITFTINGSEVFSTTDDQVVEGRAGLYLENFDDPVEATYDDVAIQSQ